VSWRRVSHRRESRIARIGPVSHAAPKPGRPGRRATDDRPAPANQHFVEQGQIALPGRGLALAWSPDGTRIAAGGRFRDKVAGLRYDTRIADVASRTLQKSFACHYFYVVATAWNANPFLGEIVADGGGDHAVKIWNARGRAASSASPGSSRRGRRHQAARRDQRLDHGPRVLARRPLPRGREPRPHVRGSGRWRPANASSR
jgi:hypothetical protein